MIRSTTLVAATAAALVLAACGGGESDTTTEPATDAAGSTEDGAGDEAAAAAPTGDVSGTVAASDVTADGGTVTVTTADGDIELTVSPAAYIDVLTEAGGRQRTRLSTWLQNNEFEGEYAFEQRGDEVTTIVG